jgi:hypothetical protein
MDNAEMLEEFIKLSGELGLRDTSYAELQEEVRKNVEESGVPDVERVLEVLKGYRFVNADMLEMHDYVRWIRGGRHGEDPKLVVGGVVTSITEHDEGYHTVKCVNRVGRFFQVKTRPDVYLFKLLSDQEVVILNVLEALDQRSMLEQAEEEQ